MVLLFQPIFKQTIWGGNKLHQLYNYDCQNNTGEAWGIAAHKNGDCVVKNTEYVNQPLSVLWKEHKELFGMYEGNDFPILVKIIDAHDDLSIQVHPSDAQAKALNSFGKKECWYILDAEKDTNIIIGHHAKNKEEFIKYIETDNYNDLIQSIPVKKRDFFYINAGTLHAICKNTLLLEVQQSSDITYRFFDYHRIYEGKERDLHLKEALEVVKIPDKDIHHQLFETPFDVKFEIIESPAKKQNHRFGTFFVILEGNGFIQSTMVKKGDFGFVDALDIDFTVSGSFEVAWINLI